VQEKEDMMQDENIWKLLARKMTGEATEEELKQLQDMIKEDPSMRYTAETFSRLWNASSVQPKQGRDPAIDTCEDS